MSQEILINITPQETRVAIIEQNAVQELHIERTRQRGIVSNIYLAKVVRVLPGMQSAFIDIGLDRAAFIHFNDLGDHHAGGQIERILFEGQTLLVQVLKDPLGTKGARLTRQISIAGRNLVYLPHDHRAVGTEIHIGISQKIEMPEEREALKNRLKNLIPADESGDIIVRTSAGLASDETLIADLKYLRTTWQGILQASKEKAAPTLLHQDLSLAKRVLRDMAGPETTQIRVDSAENFERLGQFAQTFTPQLNNKLVLYRGERALFDLFDIESEISTVFKTNLEAAQAIARQLRLRNLGGIIIIDFIDMSQIDHQEAVLNELKKNLARDHVRTNVNDFSSLGLIEMTRKRTRESLSHILCEPCASCTGKGEIKTPQTVCYEILREIVREHRQFNPKEFRIVASPDVIDLFLEEENQFLAMLGDFVQKPIRLQAEAGFKQEQYDIVLN